MFSGFGLKPPAFGFQNYSYNSLKTSSVTFKAVPSVLASSVCWSLQCLISTLTQGGDGGHFFRLTCSVPLQYSCLKNPMDRGAWEAAVHGVTQSWTRLK